MKVTLKMPMKTGKTEIKEKKISEKRIVDVLISYLRDDNHVAREVRHYEKIIDVVTMALGSDELCTVEVKTQNWKKAFQQAFVNLAVADRSYVAMYSKYAHRVDTEILREYGIGLYSVGSVWGDVELLEEANPSRYTNRITNQRIKEQLTGANK